MENEKATKQDIEMDTTAGPGVLASSETAENKSQDAETKSKAKKASSRSRKVNLDKKLAGKGTFATGVQAMMRNRINKRG